MHASYALATKHRHGLFLAAVAVVAFAVPHSVAAAELLFATPYTPLETGAQPTYASIADINGDGGPDIVSSGETKDNYGDHYPNIRTFLGPADPAMVGGSSHGFHEKSDGASMVACGDLNGDGRQDVVAAVRFYYEEDDCLWVGLGQAGAAGLTQRASYPIYGGPMGVAIGDVDGDGHADVVVTKMWTDSVAVYRGLGDGTLVPAGGVVVQNAPRSLALGDLDGDARLDIVVAHWGGPLSVLLGDGSGGFGTNATWSGGDSDGRVELDDFNADGRIDLVVGGGVLLGDGTGGFGPKLSHGVFGAFAAGDFDADGRQDLAVTSGAGLFVLGGKGDGTFAPATRYETEGHDVAVGDLDRDGDLDLVVPTWRQIAIFHANGDGTFGRSVPTYPVGRVPGGIAAGDLNGDRHPDVVVANRESKSVSTLLGMGDGRLAPGGELATGFAPHDPVLEDFNRDGHLDLAIVELWLGTLSVRDGRGDGTFGPPATIAFPNGKASSLATGDFDRDGYPDLAVADVSGMVSVWFGGVDGIGPESRHFTMNVTPSDRIEVGDVTGDGLLDLIVQGRDISLVPGHGDGTFGEAFDVRQAPQYGNFLSLATIDVCNDCSHQAFVASYCCWLTNGGDDYRFGHAYGGGCGRGSGAVNPGAANSMAVGDLDGDGIDDLVTTWVGINVSLGDGQGWFRSRQDFGLESGDAMAIADLNGDGKRDLLIAMPWQNRIAVLLNQASRAGLPDVPRRVTARAAAASIDLSWDAVDHPNLTGYRIHYEVRGRGAALAGTGAAEGPSPVTVAANQTSFALHCLPESTYSVRVTALDDLGRESRCASRVSARPLPADGEFELSDGSQNGASRGTSVMGLLQLDGGLSAADVVPGTVTLNGVGPGESMGVTDRDRDGRPELKLRFPRSALRGDGSPLRVVGLVAGCRDTLRFAVSDSARVRWRGRRAQPAEEVAVLDGAPDHQRPAAFALHQVVPTPATVGCTIAFDLPEVAAVRLQVYDLRGRLMASVVDRDMSAGAHRLWWNRSAVADGVYFVRMQAGTFRAARTIVLLR